MAIINPAMPRLYAPPGSGAPFVQKGKIAEAAAQTWLASSLVRIAAAVGVQTLEKCPQSTGASSRLVYGLSPDSSIGTGGATTPPARLFQNFHYPYDLRDVILEMTLSNNSLSGANLGANGVTFAGGGTGGVAVAIGRQCGLITLTSGTFNNYQFVDVTDTTNVVFEIVGLAPKAFGVKQTVTDNNPRVLVKVLPASLQG